MIDRVNKVLIAKAINRTAALTSATLYTGTNGPADGEVIVLDKDMKLLSAGATVADTDTIYIAEAVAETYSKTNEAGTTVTGIRKLILSDAIEGKNVNRYEGRAYAAIQEQVVTIVGSTFAPVVGTEYVLRIVYKDTYERPGQVTATYRHKATTTTAADLWTAFVAKINAHAQRRVIATTPSSNLVLTGRAMPYDVTDSVTAIDEYYQVNFKAFLYSNNFGDTTVTYTTQPSMGNGTWQRVRDVEKKALSYKGIMNRTIFPVQMPAMRTDKTKTYNSIVIEHDKSYTSPDSYNKKTRNTTELYIPTDAGQATEILAVLNPWMESAGFSSVDFV